jgi:signal transduction histidine kinase
MNGRDSLPTIPTVSARAYRPLSCDDMPVHLGFSREQVRQLTATLDAVRQDQRTALAREVHDVLGGMLTCIKWDLSRIIRRAAILPSEDISTMATDLMALVQETIDAARCISQELRPNILDTLGLTAAIRNELARFGNRCGVDTSLVVEGDEVRLSAECMTQCYRIVQEALTNVARHAQATSIRIRLAWQVRFLLIEVADDGCGIDLAASRGNSLGMLSMSERASKLGATLLVRRGEHAGTVVALTLPVVAHEESIDD